MLIETFGKNKLMKKKILILGSTGMAGHIMFHYLNNLHKYDIVNVSYRNKLNNESLILDIKDKSKVEDLIVKVSPDYIVNCIGVLIKGSVDVENAVYINSYFPHLLEKIANRVDAKLIHISTDCVFSGSVGRYKEDSFKDADDVYGRSKALGEIQSLKHLTIRTSIIGPELKLNGEGLFHWFLNQKGEVTGYTNAIWGGVTTLELAKAVEYYFENETSGVVNLTNGAEITKYDLLELIKSIWKIDNLTIEKGEGKKTINKSLVKSENFKYVVPTYETMLTNLHVWMEINRNLYTQYTY